MLDVIYVFCEMGDPWHRTATTEMLRSAKRVLHGANIVQLCDAESRLHPWADAEWRANMKCDLADYGDFKNFIVADYMAQAANPVILSEIDGLWLNDDQLQKASIPTGVAYRKFHFGIYLSFRECMDDLVPFARSLDGGEPFKSLVPKKEVNAGDPEFGALEIG